jgi:pimeloyl-ACP methyl ester carboxylesterase
LLIHETDVALPSGRDLCRAWLFVPSAAPGPAPCIVMGHGFGLTRRCRLRDFAIPIAEAGYVVLVFDYRGFGDSGGTPRQLVSFRKQVEDWRAAIAFARAQPEVDSKRVVTWGFSLGAGHALTLAARDSEVKAAIAVAPMFDGLSSTLAAMKYWSPMGFIRIVGRGLRDLIGAAFGRPPVTVRFAAPPGELGLLTSPDAFSGYQAMVPRDFNYETPARIALFFWTYLPGLLLRRFARPVLVFPSRIDKVNPPTPTLRRAKRCKSASIVELECEHMEIMLEPHRSRILSSTLEFLGKLQPLREVE